MKPALEKFLLIAATLAAIGLFIFVAMWSSIKDKKTQMDDLFNNTNVPSSYMYTPSFTSGVNQGSLDNADSVTLLSLRVYDVLADSTST
jgi:hypothetical protein